MPRPERAAAPDPDDFNHQKALVDEFFLEGLDPSQREWISLPETTRERRPVRRRRAARRRT